MAELVRPTRFVGADGAYHFELVNSPPPVGPSTEYVIYRVAPESAAVVRFVNAVAIGAGTVGTFTASLYGLYNFGIDQVAGYGGELVSVCPASFAANGQSRITWSTDVDTAYDGPDANWDHVANVPLPLTYLPPGTVVSINYLKSAGGDASPYIDFAQVVVELFNPAAIERGGGAADLYLLPALG